MFPRTHWMLGQVTSLFLAGIDLPEGHRRGSPTIRRGVFIRCSKSADPGAGYEPFGAPAPARSAAVHAEVVFIIGVAASSTADGNVPREMQEG